MERGDAVRYDETESIQDGLEQAVLNRRLVEIGAFSGVDLEQLGGIDRAATVGVMLRKCENLARGRGQTFTVWCGVFGWNAEVWGPAQGKRVIKVQTPEPWRDRLTAGQVIARVLIYLSTPLPEVTRGTIRTHSTAKCSECREPLDRQSIVVAESRGWKDPIECEHCGALLSAEKPERIGMPYMENPI